MWSDAVRCIPFWFYPAVGDVIAVALSDISVSQGMVSFSVSDLSRGADRWHGFEGKPTVILIRASCYFHCSPRGGIDAKPQGGYSDFEVFTAWVPAIVNGALTAWLV